MDKSFLAFDDHLECWPTPIRLRFQVVQEGGEIVRQGFVYASNERILAEIVRELLVENGEYIVVRLEKGRKGE